jgi:hypothetical protein
MSTFTFIAPSDVWIHNITILTLTLTLTLTLSLSLSLSLSRPVHEWLFIVSLENKHPPPHRPKEGYCFLTQQ